MEGVGNLAQRSVGVNLYKLKSHSPTFLWLCLEPDFPGIYG
jgi:hypothetical protein